MHMQVRLRSCNLFVGLLTFVRSGYAFSDGTNIISEDDSIKDCNPIVFNRCAQGESLSADGICVNTQSYDCSGQCNSSGGTYIASLGVCTCNSKDIADICDEDCQV